jgi:hypothetical protein
MTTELEGHASDLLEAMYEAQRAGAYQDEPIDTYLQRVNHDVAYGYTLIDFLADHGMAKAFHTLGRPRGNITPAGMRAVQKLYADRANPKVRAPVLRKEVITWLEGREEQGADPCSFQEFADSLESIGGTRSASANCAAPPSTSNAISSSNPCMSKSRRTVGSGRG